MQQVASSRTRTLVVSALLAALIAVSAFIAVPFGEVPFTLQTLLVALVALVLPPAAAAGAVGTYVLAGAVGMPVFAGGKAGLAVLAGPTGGFLVGFVGGAWLGSAVRLVLAKRFPGIVADVAAVATVIAVTYVVGWAQLAFVTGMGAKQAVVVGVLPFLLVDALKGAGAVAVAGALRKARLI
ncbi:MAG: biotin transporter BioY [Coriobacteriia bacterium]|nr:biotin transporter BioY [Coriobacteriia bacterium]